mmetsp:Transcript_18026/g.42130  ORF Transcript_18026/g.42130 Transcript_18026/m.42130 type:complete len:365 (-) Transcript_18026:88-1182(-)
MQKLLDAAFGHSRPSGASSSSGAAPPDASSFAVLPQQSESELTLSEVHSKLDRALEFLLRDVGYSLLDDACPYPGGGVSLSQASNAQPGQPSRGHGRPGVRQGAHSQKVPKERPEVPDSEARDLLEQARNESEQATLTATISTGTGISPGTARYARYPDDIDLVMRFTQVLSEVSLDAQQKVRHEGLYKTVLQGVRLMHLCEYEYPDVVLVLAYASVYWRNAFEVIGHKMSQHEAAHVCVLLIYLAHSFLLDETCPLRCWQKHIFRRYCTLKVLDAALFRLFKMRKFHLIISDEEQVEAFQRLRRPGTSDLVPAALQQKVHPDTENRNCHNNHANKNGNHRVKRQNGEHEDSNVPYGGGSRTQL